MPWTCLLAFATHATLGWVDVGQIIFYRDSIKGTLLGTFATGYTRYVASLDCSWTSVFVLATYV